jgi:hypothetical protein
MSSWKMNFSSVADAKACCEKALEKDESLIFYILRGNDIIDAILNQTYHTAREKREDRIYAAVTTAVVMLLALGVSIMVMPFQTMIYHLLFVSGKGFYAFYFFQSGGIGILKVW